MPSIGKSDLMNDQIENELFLGWKIWTGCKEGQKVAETWQQALSHKNSIKFEIFYPSQNLSGSIKKN